MAKKTLEEKIKRVCWWTLGLTILYFLLGAWLKSDGPNFDPGKTYELLKDTLTLTAAFLAPVAAFVLFSDWRKEHSDKRNEELIFSALKIINAKSNEIRSMIDMVTHEFQENESEMAHLYARKIVDFKQEMVIELGVLENNRVYFEDETFLNEATAFCQNQIEILDSLGRLFSASENFDDCRNSPTDPEDLSWALRFYQSSESSYLQKAEEYLECFDEQLSLLKDLAKSYKISK